ncbi:MULTISPECIES: hypothetical protein [unclassified Paenibacillus]|uniref:hypothetical protein n=1 Tax=unclassified Paenibacillus TaxID=185978 RepID=UPI001AE83D14|nr:MULTISPECIES: hypothetical protein [unclassified Paenibacillus]MBP1155917.1 glucan phosphoethanolaminetransferase (alkaline phosphatase superfamily) [Paenibacillus sp. PvP091]MBP1168697.1 glucan phosphoethanolaminetransferase (alkaline phosphatase superfamily) [Paenibacillus sp. PvR098]MBP2439725.1 glucan phosphoethanolaminetransferase (alkaline phosphatase superfamily) [Paenibacillus sp. PvP052]
MATIILLLCLIVMGSFFSAAFVLFFQKRTTNGYIFTVLGLISAAIFYYAIFKGWLVLPEAQ